MKGANIILDKSAEFAIAIVKCTSQVAKEKQEYVITKQLLKSGTSIGANVSESEYAQSKLDFIHKLSISLKEANESRYWINILKQTNYISLAEFDYLMSLINGIIYLLSKSIKTAKENLRKENEAKKTHSKL